LYVVMSVPIRHIRLFDLLGLIIFSPLYWSLLIMLAALACLPGFLLSVRLVRRVLWLDGGFVGMVALSLLLAVPALLVNGFVWRWDPLLTAFGYVVGVASVAAPRFLLRSLHPGAIATCT
jgi:hypothetical protein